MLSCVHCQLNGYVVSTYDEEFLRSKCFNAVCGVASRQPYYKRIGVYFAIPLKKSNLHHCYRDYKTEQCISILNISVSQPTPGHISLIRLS